VYGGQRLGFGLFAAAELVEGLGEGEATLGAFRRGVGQRTLGELLERGGRGVKEGGLARGVFGIEQQEDLGEEVAGGSGLSSLTLRLGLCGDGPLAGDGRGRPLALAVRGPAQGRPPLTLCRAGRPAGGSGRAARRPSVGS